MHVLAVCTGNVCRSPVVEGLLTDSWAGVVDATVRSAGTDAAPGAGVHPETARLLSAAGMQSSEFRARRLGPEHLRDPDLVIALAREHRSRIVQMRPAALRRTFTLNELARICTRVESADVLGETPDERLSTLVLHAAELRTAPSSPDEDDVPDPIDGPSQAHDAAFATIRQSVAAINRVLV